MKLDILRTKKDDNIDRFQRFCIVSTLKGSKTFPPAENTDTNGIDSLLTLSEILKLSEEGKIQRRKTES